MNRSPVTVREAVPDDARVLIELLAGLVGSAPRPETVLVDPADAEAAAVAEAVAAIARTAAEPDERLVVGLVDDGVVGVVHLRRAPLSPVRVQESVQVSALCVAPEHRGKGVATVLVSVATAWAEEKDAPFVVTAVPARDREANRYVTRLGFSQVAVLRVAPTGVLRGRFAGMAAGSRDTGRMIAVRKTLRRRHPHVRVVRSEAADPAPG